VVKVADFILVHGNGVKTTDRLTDSIRTIHTMMGKAVRPIVFNEDDHYDFDQPDSHLRAAVEVHASWGVLRLSAEGRANDGRLPERSGGLDDR
jgi:hypothetical protein